MATTPPRDRDADGRTPLAGVVVLNTRPAHQAAALTGLLRTAGATVHELPLLAVAPPRDPARAQAMLAEPADFWIVTSANAARALPDRTAVAPPRVYALGRGTTNALTRAGIAVQPLAGGSTSEDLLSHPDLQALHGQRGVVVKGEGGRDLLRAALAARGAAMHAAALYRRERVAHGAGVVQAALADVQLAIVTSGEALQALLAAVPELDRAARLDDLPLLLPSERIALQARAAGLQGELLMPATMSDSALLARVVEWQTKSLPESPPADTTGEPEA